MLKSYFESYQNVQRIITFVRKEVAYIKTTCATALAHVTFKVTRKITATVNYMFRCFIALNIHYTIAHVNYAVVSVKMLFCI